MTTFLIHGTKRYPRESWIFWLRDQLELQKQQVFLPDFPSPQGQTLENWMNIFQPYLKWLTADSTVIGHSRGVPFMLNLLEQHKAGRAIFVSGWGEGPHDFFPHAIDFERVIANCPNRLVVHAPDDHLVPYESGQKLAELLQCELHTIQDGGHFNIKSGYTEFQELLDLMQ